jgi:carbamoyltransferase
MTNSKFHNLFGGPPRKPEAELSQREMDLAASVQKVTEEVIVKLAKNIASETGDKNLCLAGGVALNCVANGILVKEKVFENIWIQPAAGDAGGALGAALVAWHIGHNKDRSTYINKDGMNGSYLGPEYSDNEIEDFLRNSGAKFYKFDELELIQKVVQSLSKTLCLSWFQGRMEFGPRALGGRSIIGDARSPKMQSVMNLKIKYRESFRPFAPSVLGEKASDWFDIDAKSPYMLLVAPVRKDKRIDILDEQKKLFGIDLLNVPRSQIVFFARLVYQFFYPSSQEQPKAYKDFSRRYRTNRKLFLPVLKGQRDEMILDT